MHPPSEEFLTGSIDPKDIIIDEPDLADPPRASGHGFRLALGGDPYETVLVTQLPDAGTYTVTARLADGEVLEVSPLGSGGWISPYKQLEPTETGWEVAADVGDRIEFTVERPGRSALTLKFGFWL